MDVVRIHRLELDCIVGIRPQEREHRQRVRLDIALHADLSQAGRLGRISLTADYDRVAHEVAALLGFRHYHLIEMAAEEVAAMLLGIHASVERVDVRIEKPGALEGRARAASVEVRRARRDYPVSQVTAPHGENSLLLETREATLELVRIEPQRSASTEVAFPARCLWWVVQGEVEWDAGRLAPEAERLEPELPGGVIQTFSDAPTRLRNPGLETACLFRCSKRTQ
jgi:FolB domain-containing protein